MAIAAIAGLASVGSAMAAATTFAIGWTAAATAFAIGAGLSMVSRALMPKPDLGQQIGGLSTTVREATAPRQILYGRARLGGNIVFLANSGSDNKYLHLVLALASHECDELEEVYFNDEKVWSGGSYLSDWATYARINFYDGTQTTADSDLASESIYWTSSHKLLGITYAAIRLAWDQEKWPNGVPNFSFVIRGKKVYNPVTDVTQWSNNPALCIRDYLLDQDYGLAEDASAINSAYMNDAIALCDESVALSGGGSHSRYQLDGVINTENSRKANIEGMLTSMGGRLVFSGGQYFLQGAKYYTPTITIDESVMVGGISVKTKQSRRSLYNAVKGVFLSEENNYTLSDYPAQISSEYQLDDGDPEYLDMALPFTVNNVRAQRLAKIALLKSRQQTTIEVPVNMAGLKLKAGDFVNISSAKMGWSAKPFEIIDYAINVSQDGQIIVNLNCIETASAIYDWTSSDQIDYLIGGEIDLYDGTVAVAPTGLTLTETSFLGGDGSLLPSILVEWTASADAFVESYQVDYKKSTESVYTTATTAGTQFYIQNPEEGASYNVRVRAINALGVTSTYVSANQSVNGDTTAPGIPSSVSAFGGLREITITWTNPTDVDFSSVEVYENTIDDYGSSTKVATVSADSFVRTGLGYDVTRFYWVKSVDYSGNKSAQSASVTATSLQVDSDAFTQDVLDLIDAAGNVKPVSSLPASGADGEIVFLTTTNALYRWDTGTTSWIPAVDAAVSIENGTITGDKVVANTITGGLLATAGIITNSAQIDNLVVTGAKIANAAITNAKIGNAEVDTLTLAGQSVTVEEYAERTTTLNLSFTEQDVLSDTISFPNATTGSGILISAAIRISIVISYSEQDAYGSATIALRIKRGATTVSTVTATLTGTGSQRTHVQAIPIMYLDEPGSGTYTYTITAEVTGSASTENWRVLAPSSMTLRGAKR
jgi:hypothetical protein